MLSKRRQSNALRRKIAHYQDTGGQINVLPEGAAGTPARTAARTPLKCTTCQIYRDTDGLGKQECRKCESYKTFQIKGTPRPPVIFEDLTELIKESCADTEKTRDIMQVIQSLPLERSVPLMMQFYLAATLQEIADYHVMSRQAVDKKNKLTIDIIKKMLHAG